jgi:hypothetical protein
MAGAKLIVLVAFDKDDGRNLVTAFDPRQMHVED